MIGCLFCKSTQVLKKVFFQKHQGTIVQAGKGSGQSHYLLKHLCQRCLEANRFRIQASLLLEGVDPSESDLKKHSSPERSEGWGKGKSYV